MGNSIFIALINPAMALVFAAAMLVLWRHQPHRRYVAVLAGSYMLIASGFLLQHFELFGATVSKLVSNICFLAGVVAMSRGALLRYGKHPPVVATALVSLGGFAVFTWFLLVDDDLTYRILAINFAIGAIALLVASELRPIERRGIADWLLFAIVLVWGIKFFVRPLIVLAIEGPYQGYEGFHQSLYWMSLLFSASLFMPIFALTIIAGIAIEVMDELRHESQTDVLSGLLNRRGFEENAEALLQAARRKAMPVALVVCDLDHFKSINDRYGHACGDQVITTFAGCLRDSIGVQNVAGRIGGEEFAVLLPGANVSTGRLFSEGVRAAFGILPIPTLPTELRCTASFGVAEWVPGETVPELFERADLALYEAKKAGRDRVCTAPRRSVSSSTQPDAPAIISGV